MEKQQFKLWEGEAPYYNAEYGQPEPTLTWYPAKDTENRSCVIVFPGGGYAGRSDPLEGGDITGMLNDNGYHAFVLNYRIAPYKHPTELSDAQRAVRFVRYNADRFGIDKDKICVLGFSAGGHLAITCSEHFDYGDPSGDEIDRVSSRPDGSVFCYPVGTLVGEYTNVGSREKLLGKEEGESELAHKLSGQLSVRDDMPPAFIWHTFGDTAVPVQNSLMLADAMRKKNIPVEMHIFPEGPHGLGLARSIPHTAQWTGLLCNWLRDYIEKR